MVSLLTGEDRVRVEVFAGFQLGQFTVTILIDSCKERLQLFLSIDAKRVRDLAISDVDIIDDHWRGLIVIFSIAATQGPPLIFESPLSIYLGHVSRTQFIIGQVLLSRVFSNAGKKSIDCRGAQFSCANKLGIGDDLVSVLIVCTPDVFFEVERFLLSLPLFDCCPVRSPVIATPHLPFSNCTIAVTIFLKEVIDLRINVKWSKTTIFVKSIVVGKELISRDHSVALCFTTVN